jgi:hypothetical protein
MIVQVSSVGGARTDLLHILFDLVIVCELRFSELLDRVVFHDRGRALGRLSEAVRKGAKMAAKWSH